MSYYDYIDIIINNNAFFNTASGIVFEFTAAKANETYTSEPVIPDSVGFQDVSAIAIYNISPYLLNNLFYFQLSGPLNINTIQNEVIKYGINTSYLFDISFSQSILSYTNFTTNTTIARDYVTYLAYALIGSTNINVFSNKLQLLQSVVNLDTGFNNTINQKIAFSGINQTNPFLSDDLSNPFIHSAKQLVTGLLTIATDTRREIFYNDLINQSQNNSENIYWVKFHTGDIMSLLINYVFNYKQINERSYKILLKCRSIIVKNVGFNLKGNLDPFYILNLVNQTGHILNLDASFVSIYNQSQISIYKEIGPIVNIVDLYYKTFLSNVTQPSLQNRNGIINNGINPSFQYIYLNSTITRILYPSLRTIKQSLITSPYNEYPTLRDIQDIQCDLNSYLGNFIIRIYTRPVYSSIDNSLNINDTFYGNYYDSKVFAASGYITYHLAELFPAWTSILTTSYNQEVYYSGGLQILQTLGHQQILSICILTYNNNANIGIENIIVSYK